MTARMSVSNTNHERSDSVAAATAEIGTNLVQRLPDGKVQMQFSRPIKRLGFDALLILGFSQGGTIMADKRGRITGYIAHERDHEDFIRLVYGKDAEARIAEIRAVMEGARHEQ